MQTHFLFGFELTPAQLAIIAAMAFLAGFAKSGVMGIGVIITPVMASVFPTGTSLGFMVPLYILGDLIAIARIGGKTVMWRPLLKTLPWGILGIVLGWLAVDCLAAVFGPDMDYYFRKLIGILMVLVVGLSHYVSRHPEIAMRKHAAVNGGVRSWYAASLGLFAGLVSMLTNSGGPIWAMYYSSLGLEVREIIGTSIWCIFTVTVAKVPLSAHLGFLDWNSVQFNMVLAPITVVGVFAGFRVSGRLTRKTFTRVVRILATTGSLYMILS